MEKHNWTIVGASVIGKGHIETDTVCEDAHHIEMINDSWGVAVVCDGAGSEIYANAHLGSQYVAKTAGKYFKAIIQETPWYIDRKIPAEAEWEILSINALKELREKLKIYAEKQEVNFKTLACTAIVLVFSPVGILSVHIGDGRAGYCNNQDEWKPAITPFKGAQVGETVFLTSEFDWEDERYVEARVIDEPIKAFTLLTDGLEWYCWECNLKDPTEEKYFDPNKPFAQFFNANVATIQRLAEKNSFEDLQNKWAGYLQEGHPKIKEEQDDKTMILGALKLGT